MSFTDVIWLVIALPLVGVLFNGILGRRVGYKVVRWVGPAVIGLAFVVGLGAFAETYSRGGTAKTVELWTWAAFGDALTIPINLFVDPLSTLMVLVITGVGFLIHIYATDYMVHHHHGHTEPDRDFTRFFTFLNLFVASMLILVLGDNYAMMFVGWELVGACSYLLIGFWYDRGEDPQPAIEIDGAEPVSIASLLSPAASGMKAFVVNRIGDVGFALGIFMIWSTFGTLQYTDVFGRIASGEATGGNTLAIIAFLLFIGAMGKSAQMPLYVWLPDAMAGPTPVSALIHAATMVTAGVYMVIRSHVIYMHAPEVSLFVAVVGVVTALFAGTIALVQVDLKRVLAYSTVSQLGYMFLAVGVAGYIGSKYAYVAGMFHLMTHAFFKALLFLGAGSVMHALGDVIDIRRMGGLRHKMPITFYTFVIGGAALAGFPFITAGFYSKDSVLMYTFYTNPILWGLGIIAAGLTSFYTFRAIFIAFFGQPRDQALYDHAHENKAPVTIPLAILAVLSIFGGLLGLPYALVGADPSIHFLNNYMKPIFIESNIQDVHSEEVGHGDDHSATDSHGDEHATDEHATDSHGDGHGGEPHLPLLTEWLLVAASVVMSLGGIGLAALFYIRNPAIPVNLARSTRPLFALLANKYYIDEIYDAILVKPTSGLAEAFAKGVDVIVIDGLVDGTAKTIRSLSPLLSLLQNGYTSRYALATFVGVLIMIGYFIVG